MRITVTLPVAMKPDGNQMAMVLAFGPADAETYRGANWRDGAGNLYAVASFEARDEWIMGARGPLQRPKWDASTFVNMAGAARAQAAMVFWKVDDTAPAPEAAPNKMTAIGGVDGVAAMALMGLSQVIENA